jgi:dephospho-CoA kinase
MKIAITGKMCSGKTTLANMIMQIDSRYEKFSFGQKVKDIAFELFYMNPEFKDRTLLTNIGTKMRDINPNVWINYILNQTKHKKYCIIDDLRYQNEYESLVKDGWIIIKLNISDKIQEERIKNLYSNFEDHLQNRNHLSEQNNFEWMNNSPDLIIQSDQESKKIYQQIYTFLQKHEK